MKSMTREDFSDDENYDTPPGSPSRYRLQSEQPTAVDYFRTSPVSPSCHDYVLERTKAQSPSPALTQNKLYPDLKSLISLKEPTPEYPDTPMYTREPRGNDSDDYKYAPRPRPRNKIPDVAPVPQGQEYEQFDSRNHGLQEREDYTRENENGRENGDGFWDRKSQIPRELDPYGRNDREISSEHSLSYRKNKKETKNVDKEEDYGNRKTLKSPKRKPRISREECYESTEEQNFPRISIEDHGINNIRKHKSSRAISPPQESHSNEREYKTYENAEEMDNPHHRYKPPKWQDDFNERPSSDREMTRSNDLNCGKKIDNTLPRRKNISFDENTMDEDLNPVHYDMHQQSDKQSHYVGRNDRDPNYFCRDGSKREMSNASANAMYLSRGRNSNVNDMDNYPYNGNMNNRTDQMFEGRPLYLDESSGANGHRPEQENQYYYYTEESKNRNESEEDMEKHMGKLHVDDKYYIQSEKGRRKVSYGPAPDGDPNIQRKRTPKLTMGNLVAILIQKPDYKISIDSLMKTGIDPSHVKEIVNKQSHIFEEIGGIVKIRLNIDICEQHLNNGCTNKDSCRKLHLCSDYLSQTCSNDGCELGHKLNTKHNESILAKFYLDGVPEKVILEMLRLSISQSFQSGKMSICKKYVSGNCIERNCIDLHICPSYLCDQCQNQICHLDHCLLSPYNCRVLQKFGIDTNESPRDVTTILRDKFPYLFITQRKNNVNGTGDYQTDRIYNGSSSERSRNERHKPYQHNASGMGNATGTERETIYAFDYDGNTEIAEICYYSVTSKCKYEYSGCHRLHADQHYHWQVKKQGFGWLNLGKAQVESLERAYINPSIDNINIPQCDPKNCPRELVRLLGKTDWQAQFPGMFLLDPISKNTLDIRRLCSQNVDGLIKASWSLWYFLDQNNIWVQYGQIDTTKRDFLVSNITSDDIERYYQKYPASQPLVFKNKMFNYILDFQTMTQTNTHTGVVRNVKRRPMPHFKTSIDTKTSGQKKKKWLPKVTWD